jgi:PAS domain S-box-containing protein
MFNKWIAEQALLAVSDPMNILDRDYRIIWANKARSELHQISFKEMIGHYCYETFQKHNEPCEGCPVTDVFRTGNPCTRERSMIRPDGNRIWTETLAWPVFDDRQKISYVVEYARNITDRKHSEEALREREKELLTKTQNLEELNIALKVLLKKSDEDKIEIEEKLLLNIKELIFPYLERLKMTILDERQKTYVSILESNLKDIISPFSDKLSSIFLDFTPVEIQVVNLLHQGKTSKEIGKLFHCSPNTISFHRRNIRKKLGLNNKKTDLKSYLRSLHKNDS